jgi:hypothetical protein
VAAVLHHCPFEPISTCSPEDPEGCLAAQRSQVGQDVSNDKLKAHRGCQSWRRLACCCRERAAAGKAESNLPLPACFSDIALAEPRRSENIRWDCMCRAQLHVLTSRFPDTETANTWFAREVVNQFDDGSEFLEAVLQQSALEPIVFLCSALRLEKTHVSRSQYFPQRSQKDVLLPNALRSDKM